MQGTVPRLVLFGLMAFLLSVGCTTSNPPGLILSTAEAARQRALFERDRRRAGAAVHALLLRKGGA